MKKILLVAAAAAGLVSIAPAFAADGTITISGNVTGSTCQINAPAGSSFTVALPTVSTTALSAAGSTAGNKLFTIALTGCTGGNTATAYFEQGANIDASTGYLKNTASGGSNVQVRLLNDDLTTEIKLNQAQNSQGAKAFPITSGKATLNYYAQYYAATPATVGAVSTSVQYTMQYQ